MLATGQSQSAAFLVTYVNAIDALDAVYDGFFVRGRQAVGASLERGYRPGRSRDSEAAAGEQTRADARVPVLVLQAETDVAALGSGRAAQPDGDRVRLWELAGTAHADTYLLVASHHDDGRLPAERLAKLLKPTMRTIAGTTDRPINSAPQHHYVACAAVDHLDRWAAGGPPPPIAPRLELNSDGTDFHREYYGIATGGIRTPWTDVPAATLSGLGQSGSPFAFLFGTTEPIEMDELTRMYPGGKSDYMRKFTEGVDAAVAKGFLLADDRAEILGLAAAAFS
ncbi:MAG: alpha/beta hydrolase domain-containing protein [Streptosporangiaceae bacterium]